MRISFYIVVNADPQMGAADSRNRGIRRRNALLEAFVSDINQRDLQPAFVLFNGDLVSAPDEASFDNFVRLVRPLEAPLHLIHGNHDGDFRSTLFEQAQAALTNDTALDYSFDVGNWHFVGIAAKQKHRGQEDKRAQLAWLRADLEANAHRPTVAFVHYHLLPIGLPQLEYYTLEKTNKDALLDVLTTVGDVRYVISGHVHPGVQASVKSAWTYRDTHFIVAPSTIEPRGFGEEYPEFIHGQMEDDGYYLEMYFSGEEVKLVGRDVGTDLARPYPIEHRIYDPEKHEREHAPFQSATVSQPLINGGFERGLRGWSQPYRYPFQNPPFAVSTVARPGNGRGQSLEIVVNRVQSVWERDHSFELFQVVPAAADSALRFQYYVTESALTAAGGAYVWVTLFDEGGGRHTVLMHWGAREERVQFVPRIMDYAETGAVASNQARQARIDGCEFISLRLPDRPGWHGVAIHFEQLFGECGDQFSSRVSSVSHASISLGAWAGDAPGAAGRVVFDNVRFGSAEDLGIDISRRNGKPWHYSAHTAVFPYDTMALPPRAPGRQRRARTR